MLFLRHFLFTEKTAGTQRDAHRGEIFRADDADVRHGKIHQRYLRLVEKVDAGGGTQTGQWRIVFHGDGADSGNGADACKQLLEKCHAQFVRGVLGLRKGDLEGQEVSGIKARMDADEAHKAANQQTGAGEKDEREAQLRDDEGAPCEAAAFAGGRTAATFS